MKSCSANGYGGGLVVNSSIGVDPNNSHLLFAGCSGSVNL